MGSRRQLGLQERPTQPPSIARGTEVIIRIATTRTDVLRCQHFIAKVYNLQYGIIFSADAVDLESKVEPFPHRYLMGLVGDELVATSGLYVRDTYVQRYGKLPAGAVAAELERAGASSCYDADRLREPTKLVVDPAWTGRGLGIELMKISFSQEFLQCGDEPDRALLLCARHSIFRNMVDLLGVRTRPLASFPAYRAHEHYRSPTDPMDSRLIIPHLDIPPELSRRQLPSSLFLSCSPGRRRCAS